MKTIGIRSLRENPAVLSQCAAAGEYVLVTNRNKPMALSIPFDDDLIRCSVHENVAIKFYQDEILTLVKAAQLAKMSVEGFIQKLAVLDIVVVNQTAEELRSDIESIGE